MTLRSPNSVAGGVWRSGSSPQTVWYGDMTDQGYPNAPIQLQIYGEGSGILQTIYGWFRVTQYRTTPSGIAFELDGLREVAPDRSQGRSYHHHLMDYNNDPTTTFADTQSLFSEALQRMSDSSWLASHGFSAK